MIVLSFDRTGLEHVQIEIPEDFLQVVDEKHEENRDVFFINQIKDHTEWSQYSSSFMGEICCKKEADVSRISVIQNCTNNKKSNHVSVVNPKWSKLRVHPQNIVEIILYDLGFTYQDEWNWEWTSNDGVGVELLGRDTLSLYYLNKQYLGNPDLRYSMYPCVSTEKIMCRQHHMWFRFNKSILKSMSKETGIKTVGFFQIDGKSNKFQPNSSSEVKILPIDVDFRKPKRGLVLSTLCIEDKSSEQAKVSSKQWEKWNKRKWTDYLTIKNVSVDKIDIENLYDGCNVLSPNKETNEKSKLFLKGLK